MLILGNSLNAGNHVYLVIVGYITVKWLKDKILIMLIRLVVFGFDILMLRDAHVSPCVLFYYQGTDTYWLTVASGVKI